MSTLNGRAFIGVENKTANYAIAAGVDNGKHFTNLAAAGAITFTLPAATVGQWYEFHVQANQELRIDPNGTETIALPSTGAQSAAGKYISADAIGEYVRVLCIEAGKWVCPSHKGTFTAEA